MNSPKRNTRIRRPNSRSEKRKVSPGIKDSHLADLERHFAQEIRRVHNSALRSLGFRSDQIRGVKPKSGSRSALKSIFERISSDVDQKLKKVAIIDPKKFTKVDTSRIIKTNASLIKTASQLHLDRLQTLIDEEQLLTLSLDQAAKKLQTQLQISTSKAKFWARDQGLKFNANVTKRRALSVGLNRYEWVQAGGARPMHADLDGQEFSFDDPPVTNEDGDTNNPGEDYNCKCIAFLIV